MKLPGPPARSVQHAPTRGRRATTSIFGLRSPLLAPSFTVLLSDDLQIFRSIFARCLANSFWISGPIGLGPRALIGLPLFRVLECHAVSHGLLSLGSWGAMRSAASARARGCQAPGSRPQRMDDACLRLPPPRITMTPQPGQVLHHDRHGARRRACKHSDRAELVGIEAVFSWAHNRGIFAPRQTRPVLRLVAALGCCPYGGSEA